VLMGAVGSAQWASLAHLGIVYAASSGRAIRSADPGPLSASSSLQVGRHGKARFPSVRGEHFLPYGPTYPSCQEHSLRRSSRSMEDAKRCAACLGLLNAGVLDELLD